VLGDGSAGADRPLSSRDELLGGLPARRASGILFAIEARTARLMPTIRDLERYAGEWAQLVPDNPGSRAAVAILIAAKYRFNGLSVGVPGTVHLVDATGERTLTLDAAGTAASHLGGPGQVVVRWQWHGGGIAE
jgi:hypothetical protein